ncbi:hypothetical protein [Microbulbifer sp. PSTR4-B]|uniref:hypothetical protein n=1 Tax=unclassified Microbulbifer TaxID=2619833 RepID=UPI00403B360B
MFDLNIDNKNNLHVIENGNEHIIPIVMEYWNTRDLILHWGYETYDLLDGYALRFLLTGMHVLKGQGYIRAFRTVRTRNKIHFDDVLIVAPWNVQQWEPIEALEYIVSPHTQTVYDYQFKLPDRIPEFFVTSDELSFWNNETIEKDPLAGTYEPKYKLYTEQQST